MMTKYEKNKMLDEFGEKVICFRDRNLRVSMNCATGESVNPVKRKKYGALADLNAQQREAINNLLSETITSTIYDFLEMFEENPDSMKLVLIKDGYEYNMADISEKMGSEITFDDENGWIQKFSEIGRFVL